MDENKEGQEVQIDESLNGIVDGVYYENGVPTHKGVIIQDGFVYYAGRHGVLAKGHHNVHREMSNGILKRGTYQFDDDGKLIENYYKKPVSKTKRKVEKYVKKKKKEIKSSYSKGKLQKSAKLAITFAAVFVIVLVVAVVVNNRNNVSSEGSIIGEVSDGSPAIILPSFDEPVYLCNDSVKEYYKGNITFTEAVNMNGSANPYKSLVFQYSVKNYVADEKSNNMIVLELSKNEQFSSPETYFLDSDETYITIDNLLPNTKYYYRAYFKNTQKSKDKFSGSFVTAEYDRFTNIDGITNMRDIGGYSTSSGKTVRYNMILRGSEFDGLVNKSYYLKNPEQAKEFGFVFDMDLRESYLFNDNYISRLGNNVRHDFYTAPMYGSVFKATGLKSIKKVFADLADKNNYPMYMHCTYGKDRTGTIIFLLQSVLGVSDEDKNNQYLLSKFIFSDISNSNLYPIYNGLDSYEGSNTNEKVISFLKKDVGVTQAQIDSIRNILLESD